MFGIELEGLLYLVNHSLLAYFPLLLVLVVSIALMSAVRPSSKSSSVDQQEPEETNPWGILAQPMGFAVVLWAVLCAGDFEDLVPVTADRGSVVKVTLSLVGAWLVLVLLSARKKPI